MVANGSSENIYLVKSMPKAEHQNREREREKKKLKKKVKKKRNKNIENFQSAKRFQWSILNFRFLIYHFATDRQAD